MRRFLRHLRRRDVALGYRVPKHNPANTLQALGRDSREELDHLLRKVIVPFVEVCLGLVGDEDTRTGMDRFPELLAKELTGRRLERKRLPLAIHASVDDNGL